MEDWLIKHGNEVLLAHRAAILYQVAVGMGELGRLGIVHRDLAARNVLVGPELQTKVCDLGMSRDGAVAGAGFDAEHEPYYRLQSDNAPLPLRWMAPEVFLNGMKFNARTDVYSFGIVL